MRRPLHQALRVVAVLGATGQAALAATQQPLTRGPTTPFDKVFARLVSKTLERWHVPGIAIAVVDGNDTWAEVRVTYSVRRLPHPLDREAAPIPVRPL